MENQTPPVKKKRSPALFIVLAIIVVASFFGIRSFVHNLHYESTDNAQIESRAVPVVSRVAGYIDSLGVDDFQKVQAGQTLLLIDSKEYELALAQAEADLLNAQADLANANAAYTNSLANRKVISANADVQQTRLIKAKNDLTRDEGLFKEQAITQRQLDDTRSNYDATNKQYTANLEQIRQANAQVATAEAQVEKAKALIETRKAAVDQAKLRLSYCKITAPVAGRIGRRPVDKGQLIQAGAPLFSIVNDEDFWIVANFKETQIEKMKEGQPVSIKLDGYPDVELHGKISSLSQATGAKFSLLPPDNATGNFVKVTQRVPVKIDLTDADQHRGILRAGLSAEVEVNID